MNKLGKFNIVFDVISSITSLFIFIILTGYCGWTGAILWLVNIITLIFSLGSDNK